MKYKKSLKDDFVNFSEDFVMKHLDSLWNDIARFAEVLFIKKIEVV